MATTPAVGGDAPVILGDLVIEGKTKVIRAIPAEPGCVHVQSKDSISSGDGARMNEIAGKAVVANRTTCSLFAFLARCGVPTHFVRQDGPSAFVARRVRMIPVEFVTRRLATGSYLRRHKVRGRQRKRPDWTATKHVSPPARPHRSRPPPRRCRSRSKKATGSLRRSLSSSLRTMPTTTRS